MNTTLINYARQELKSGLAQCNEAQILLFKRMYSHKDLDKDINQVVDDMPVEKLDWALSQVERTIKKS